ncbi:thioredoxin-dependent thiol peroxidase [Corynebacterium aquatimens]|uniref:thioredoxin-dependent peroxiredoxin n=1 Tax=Corynebacterium aquatimens TaxID=1190508 RepID=A0A931DVE6_9CORY|nr:thioredoxin-dependent thiol peroxidase [Corynebacterium aquatimens]MBG6122229.1 peroxiredoxin Q/BCP [Corynebacterium aquatimens]WJY65230.1 Putative peroxiredoxin [Corynebacterium aquatimens]
MSERHVLTKGDKAPDFSLPNDKGETVSLSDYAGQKVIVYFYPKASTPGCTTEACDFSENLELFNDAKISVVGISPDSPEKLATFREENRLNFELLSDESKETLVAYGAFGEKKNYGKVVEGVIRSTFLVDEQGVIKSAFYNVKATGHVARLLRDVV